MNFASFERAYSLYPTATFEERTSLICTSHHSDSNSSAYKKYRDRGWTVQKEYPLANMITDYHAQSPIRHVGDKHCWVVSLGVDPGWDFGPELSPQPDGGWTGWRLTSLVCSDTSLHTEKL